MKNNLTLGVVLFLPLLFAGCEQSPSQSPSSTSTTSTNTVKAEDSFKSKWPLVLPHANITVDTQSALTRNYYVVFDGSGSMSSDDCAGTMSKAKAGKAALIEFSKSVPADANLGLLVFDGRGVSERVALGKNNREQFIEKVNAVEPSSGTPLRTAIEQAYTALTKEGIRQQGYGQYNLIIVTDGEASGGEEPAAIVNKILRQSPILIHTIGFCIKTNHSLNQPGRIDYKSAMNVSELKASLNDVLAESKQFVPATFK